MCMCVLITGSVSLVELWLIDLLLKSIYQNHQDQGQGAKGKELTSGAKFKVATKTQ